MSSTRIKRVSGTGRAGSFSEQLSVTERFVHGGPFHYCTGIEDANSERLLTLEPDEQRLVDRMLKIDGVTSFEIHLDGTVTVVYEEARPKGRPDLNIPAFKVRHEVRLELIKYFRGKDFETQE